MSFAVKVLCSRNKRHTLGTVTLLLAEPPTPDQRADRARNVSVADQRIRELVAAAPPLTPDQREDLAALVRPSARLSA